MTERPIVTNTEEQSADFGDMVVSAINGIAMFIGTSGVSVAVGMITFCATLVARYDKDAATDFLRALTDMVEKDDYRDPELEALRAEAAAKIYRAHDLMVEEPAGSA